MDVQILIMKQGMLRIKTIEVDGKYVAILITPLCHAFESTRMEAIKKLLGNMSLETIKLNPGEEGHNIMFTIDAVI